MKITADALAGTEAPDRRPSLEEGTYSLELGELFTITSRDEKEYFIIEGTVKTSTNPNFPPGTLVKKMYPQDTPEQLQRVLGGLRSLFRCLGVVTEADVKEIYLGLEKDTSSLKGEVVGARVVNKVAQKSGFPYAHLTWEIVAPTDAAA